MSHYAGSVGWRHVKSKAKLIHWIVKSIKMEKFSLQCWMWWRRTNMPTEACEHSQHSPAPAMNFFPEGINSDNKLFFPPLKAFFSLNIRKHFAKEVLREAKDTSKPTSTYERLRMWFSSWQMFKKWKANSTVIEETQLDVGLWKHRQMWNWFLADSFTVGVEMGLFVSCVKRLDWKSLVDGISCATIHDPPSLPRHILLSFNIGGGIRVWYFTVN